MQTSTKWIIILALVIVAGGIYFFITSASINGNLNSNTIVPVNLNRNTILNNTAVNQQANANENTNTAFIANTNSAANINSAPNTNFPSNSNSASLTASVAATTEGFFPLSVIISSGGTVTWINNSTDTVYVAPADHPAHKKYPGIWDDDGAGNIAPGEMYSHTFSSPGTYSYHDHLNSSFTGTVTVQ